MDPYGSGSWGPPHGHPGPPQGIPHWCERPGRSTDPERIPQCPGSLRQLNECPGGLRDCSSLRQMDTCGLRQMDSCSSLRQMESCNRMDSCGSLRQMDSCGSLRQMDSCASLRQIDECPGSLRHLDTPCRGSLRHIPETCPGPIRQLADPGCHGSLRQLDSPFQMSCPVHSPYRFRFANGGPEYYSHHQVFQSMFSISLISLFVMFVKIVIQLTASRNTNRLTKRLAHIQILLLAALPLGRAA